MTGALLGADGERREMIGASVRSDGRGEKGGGSDGTNDVNGSAVSAQGYIVTAIEYVGGARRRGCWHDAE